MGIFRLLVEETFLLAESEAKIDDNNYIDNYIKKENEDRRRFNPSALILEDPEIIERLKQYTFQLRKEIEKFMKEKAKNGEIEIEKRPY